MEDYKDNMKKFHVPNVCSTMCMLFDTIYCLFGEFLEMSASIRNLKKKVWQPVLEKTTYVNIRKWKASYMRAICAKKLPISQFCTHKLKTCFSGLVCIINVVKLKFPNCLYKKC